MQLYIHRFPAWKFVYNICQRVRLTYLLLRIVVENNPLGSLSFSLAWGRGAESFSFAWSFNAQNGLAEYKLS